MADSDDFMQQRIRVFASNYKNPADRNYFSQMTAIGPAFGATRESSPEMSREEACNLVQRWSMFVDYEFEICGEVSGG